MSPAKRVEHSALMQSLALKYGLELSQKAKNNSPKMCHAPNIYSVIYLYLSPYNGGKQLSRGVLKKRCSENMQQIYRRTPMPKCDFNKVALLKPKFDIRKLSIS